MSNQSIIEIKPATRQAAKLIIGLAGQTGDGKTYSALMLALGLANGDPSKIGLLDCENRRGSFYSDIFDTPTQKRPFLLGDFSPPHSPARYIQAMNEFMKCGIEVLVIDSMSHEHEGQGGLEEIANAPKANGDARKVADWLTAKREHRKFMNALLHLPSHVIACFRAREKTDFKDPTKPRSLGIQPITEKNVMFEVSASFMMLNKGKSRDIIKLPECLRPILDVEGYFTEAHGKALREWVGGNSPIENAKNILRLASGNGLEAFKKAWLSLDKAAQKELAEFKDTLKDAAVAADEENAPPQPEQPASTGPQRTARPVVATSEPKRWSDLLANDAWTSVKIPEGYPYAGESVAAVIIDPDAQEALEIALPSEHVPEVAKLTRWALDCAFYVNSIQRRFKNKNLTLDAIEALMRHEGALQEDESILTCEGSELITICETVKDLLASK